LNYDGRQQREVCGTSHGIDVFSASFGGPKIEELAVRRWPQRALQLTRQQMIGQRAVLGFRFQRSHDRVERACQRAHDLRLMRIRPATAVDVRFENGVTSGERKWPRQDGWRELEHLENPGLQANDLAEQLLGATSLMRFEHHPTPIGEFEPGHGPDAGLVEDGPLRV
jgi:hypothetical protein